MDNQPTYRLAYAQAGDGEHARGGSAATLLPPDQRRRPPPEPRRAALWCNLLSLEVDLRPVICFG